jgi:exonuclease III
MSFIFRTIVSQNIHGFPNFVRAKRNISKFLKKIKPYNPDLILLQEVFREKWLIKNSVELDGYLALYKTNPLFIEGGLVILIKKDIYNMLLHLGFHFELIYQDYTLQGVLRSAQIVSHISKKGYLHLKICNSSDVIDIINTHTTSAFSKKEKKVNRKLQVLQSQLQEFSSYTYTLPESKAVIGGDFNFDILADSELFPNYCHYPSTKKITFPKHSTRIDFILTRNIDSMKLKILNSVRMNISDHNGLVLKLVK